MQGYSLAWCFCVTSQPQQLAISHIVKRPAGKLSTSPAISGFTDCAGQQGTSVFFYNQQKQYHHCLMVNNQGKTTWVSLLNKTYQLDTFLYPRQVPACLWLVPASYMQTPVLPNLTSIVNATYPRYVRVQLDAAGSLQSQMHKNTTNVMVRGHSTACLSICVFCSLLLQKKFPIVYLSLHLLSCRRTVE